MKIDLAIIAHNEGKTISSTVHSVSIQKLLSDTEVAHSVAVYCIANGCTDDTVEVCEREFRLLREKFDERVTFEVVQVPVASKENAWNVFVHEKSRKDSDFLIFMDGDVELGSPDSLGLLVEKLREDSFLLITGGNTIKHIDGTKTWNPLILISRAATRLRMTQDGQLCGMLYCGRTEFLRRFRIPTFIVGEDAFVHAMTVTNLFTEPVNQSRFVRVEDARVFFEAYLRPRDVWKNLKRRQVGYCIKGMLYGEFWRLASKDRDAGKLMEDWSAEDPDWGKKLVERKIGERGWMVIPWSAFWVWLERWMKLSAFSKVVLFPAALAATLVNSVVILSANKAIHKREFGRLWQAKNTGR